MNAVPVRISSVLTKTIADMVRWTKEGGGNRLYLPTIQRSIVWRNSQIINYWDSLLRGYPAGLMMIHNPKGDALRARTSDGNTCEIQAGDFQLFDGQQRLTAILLGLGEGQLKDRLKLWVDLGCDMAANSDLRFMLRISSTGQPFGYQPAAPNDKFPLYKRRDKATEWKTRACLDRFPSSQVFIEAEGRDLIDSTCAIPLREITTLLQIDGEEKTVAVMQTRYPSISVARVENFVHALNRALTLPILFQVIDPAVIEREEEYIRFFGRLGQGGTALTNDELTYSIIKYQFPEIHDRMKEITDGQAGRVASEVNLVLAALRVAKVSAPWNASGDWQIYGRPTPSFVSRLKSELTMVREEFQRLIPNTTGGRLRELLESIRQSLEYDEKTNPSGLPVILLARLPHQLIDVLILMESQRPPKGEFAFALPAFVLYWLLFVADSDKAANIIFKRFCRKETDWQPHSDYKLIRHLEEQGISRRLPSVEFLGEACDEIRRGTHLLRSWGERFAALDANKEMPAGDALRVLSTHPELIRCALLWLQRKYLSEQFSNYDPTSSRDEDLPIDLDHLIPRKNFGDDWRPQQRYLSFQDEGDNFRYRRGMVGNSLGNYRWLDASDNRGRQAGTIEESDGTRDTIEGVREWNALIEKKQWTEQDVAAFQTKIDLRSIAIYMALLDEGGLSAFALVAEQNCRSPI